MACTKAKFGQNACAVGTRSRACTAGKMAIKRVPELGIGFRFLLRLTPTNIDNAGPKSPAAPKTRNLGKIRVLKMATVFGHFCPKFGTPSSGIISTTFWSHQIIQVDIRRLLKFQPIPVPFATSSEFFCVPVSPFWTIFQTVFSGGKKIFP